MLIQVIGVRSAEIKPVIRRSLQRTAATLPATQSPMTDKQFRWIAWQIPGYLAPDGKNYPSFDNNKSDASPDVDQTQNRPDLSA